MGVLGCRLFIAGEEVVAKHEEEECTTEDPVAGVIREPVQVLGTKALTLATEALSEAVLCRLGLLSRVAGRHSSCAAEVVVLQLVRPCCELEGSVGLLVVVWRSGTARNS